MIATTIVRKQIQVQIKPKPTAAIFVPTNACRPSLIDKPAYYYVYSMEWPGSMLIFNPCLISYFKFLKLLNVNLGCWSPKKQQKFSGAAKESWMNRFKNIKSTLRNNWTSVYKLKATAHVWRLL